MSQLGKRVITIVVLVALISGGLVGAYQCRQNRDRNKAGERVSSLTVQRPNGNLKVLIDGIAQNTRKERHTLYRISVQDASGHELARIFTDYYKPTCKSSGQSQLSCTWNGKTHNLDPATLSEK